VPYSSADVPLMFDIRNILVRMPRLFRCVRTLLVRTGRRRHERFPLIP